MKLLVVMPSKYLGNMTIAMRALGATLERYREDDVVLLVDETFEELTRLFFGRLCSIVVYPRRAVGQSSALTRARRYLGFLSTLRASTFDCALDFDGTVVSGRVMRFTRARQKIGPGFAKRPGAYNRLIPIDRDSQHCFDDFVALAGAVDARPEEDTYLPPPAAPDSCWQADLPDLQGGPIALIHPCATKDYKQWDIARFAVLADGLLAGGWRVMLVGAGGGERARVAAMLQRMTDTPVNLHDRLSLLQLLYLFQHATVFIGNDSGPMHLAAATGIDTLALFGPTELLRWRPRGPRVHVIKGPAPCAPECRPEACLRSYQCLASLSAEQVLAAVADLDAR